MFITEMTGNGFDVVGQVRRDARLYDGPIEKRNKARGRPRKYGEKYTPKRIAHPKRTAVKLNLNDKMQMVRYRGTNSTGSFSRWTVSASSLERV